MRVVYDKAMKRRALTNKFPSKSGTIRRLRPTVVTLLALAMLSCNLTVGIPFIGGQEASPTAAQTQPGQAGETAYPGPATEAPAYPPPGDQGQIPAEATVTASPTPVTVLPSDTPVASVTITLEPTASATAVTAFPSLTPIGQTPTASATLPVTIAPSFTPLPTFWATSTYEPLPVNFTMIGNWQGFRRIQIKRRDCEESIAHTLSWRFEQLGTSLWVNNDLTGYINGRVVVLEGQEKFLGGTLDLTYILSVGPDRHTLSGRLYGAARLAGFCQIGQTREYSVPNGSLEVTR